MVWSSVELTHASTVGQRSAMFHGIDVEPSLDFPRFFARNSFTSLALSTAKPSRGLLYKCKMENGSFCTQHALTLNLVPTGYKSVSLMRLDPATKTCVGTCWPAMGRR